VSADVAIEAGNALLMFGMAAKEAGNA
jgi:hypothetical protein